MIASCTFQCYLFKLASVLPMNERGINAGSSITRSNEGLFYNWGFS